MIAYARAVSEHDRRWRRLTRRELLQTPLVLGTAAAVGCLAPPKGEPLEAEDTSRAVQRVVVGVRKREGAGFMVNRPFPTRELALVDPFLLLDEFGPVDYGPHEAIGAPDHPHRGFETVSYILKGDIHHRDSMGHDAVMGPGGVQWMTAGSGIVHAEMPSRELFEAGGEVHGFQLWVNLPRDLKMMAPHYQELLPDQVAHIQSERGDAIGRLVAGSALGVEGAIATTLPTRYQHWTLRPGSSVELPVEPEQRAAAWVFSGRARLGADARAVAAGSLAIFGDGEVVRMGADADADQPAELLLLAAAPLGEPVARRGPFVMNTEAELREAYRDYRAGRMGSIG